MAENPDYKELLQLLNEFEVEYLIVGGFAVMKYGEPRYTKDWISGFTTRGKMRNAWSVPSTNSALPSRMTKLPPKLSLKAR
jgi:hypothetical protein